MEADKRWSGMEAEEASLLFTGTVVVIPGIPALVGAVVSQAPIRRLAVQAGAMTVVRGSGLLSQVIERGHSAVSCGNASSPGVCDRR